jgi:hypothetical protein
LGSCRKTAIFSAVFGFFGGSLCFVENVAHWTGDDCKSLEKSEVGATGGATAGATDGASIGASGGAIVGASVGASVGSTAGAIIGATAGAIVGAVGGATDGASVGATNFGRTGATVSAPAAMRWWVWLGSLRAEKVGSDSTAPCTSSNRGSV